MDSAKSLIYIYLDGGMSHIDTFDLKPGWKQQGPVKGIATNVTGLKFSAHLPMLARHADKLAIIRSMHSNQGAHDQGQYFLHTSYEPREVYSTQGSVLGLISCRVIRCPRYRVTFVLGVAIIYLEAAGFWIQNMIHYT